MRKAADKGNAPAMLLFGMAAALRPRCIPKDEIGGGGRSAAPPTAAPPAPCSSWPISTKRAIMASATILSREATLLDGAAEPRDPSAKETLANLERSLDEAAQE